MTYWSYQPHFLLHRPRQTVASTTEPRSSYLIFIAIIIIIYCPKMQTDTANNEQARQQGSRALAAALKKNNKIQHENSQQDIWNKLN